MCSVAVFPIGDTEALEFGRVATILTECLITIASATMPVSSVTKNRAEPVVKFGDHEVLFGSRLRCLIIWDETCGSWVRGPQ